MTLHDECPEPRERLLVLALVNAPAPMQPLLLQLRRAGVDVDVALDLQAARTSFFSAGGHDCLVVGPDVQPGVARRVASSLERVDPELAFASFGPDIDVHTTCRAARLGAFHPGSRAGQGALLRFLRTL